MRAISFKRHRFPPDVIGHAVWLYFRFTLSIRDVEELLAQRGVEVSREAVRCWVNKFGPLIAANLRRRRGPPTLRVEVTVEHGLQDGDFLPVSGHELAKLPVSLSYVPALS